MTFTIVSRKKKQSNNQTNKQQQQQKRRTGSKENVFPPKFATAHAARPYGSRAQISCKK